MHHQAILASFSAVLSIAAASSCTIIGYVDTTDATNLGGTNVNEYWMGWKLIQDGTLIASPTYGNDDPCAYDPADLDSPLPYTIEWSSDGCDPDITSCKISYGDQIGITGTSESNYDTDVLDTSLSEACYVEFTC